MQMIHMSCIYSQDQSEKLVFLELLLKNIPDQNRIHRKVLYLFNADVKIIVFMQLL
jgi:hypothetical protein